MKTNLPPPAVMMKELHPKHFGAYMQAFKDRPSETNADFQIALMKSKAREFLAFLVEKGWIGWEPVRGKEIVNARLDGGDFHGLNLSGLRITDCVLADSNFQGCNLQSARIRDCHMRYCDFDNARFDYAQVINCDVSESSCYLTNFKACDLSSTILCDSEIEFAEFAGARMNGTRVNVAPGAIDVSRASASGLLYLQR